jgi:ribonuclease HI
VTVYVRRARPRLDVYTDGACSGAPGPGGWAWAADSGNLQDSGYEPSTTNQRMELRAALEAVQALGAQYRVTIHSDSAYLINCFEEGWHLSWKDGRKRDGSPVSNWDIWKPLIRAILKYRVDFVKVKGHSGNAGNDYVDRLAVKAKKSGTSKFESDWSGARDSGF